MAFNITNVAIELKRDSANNYHWAVGVILAAFASVVSNLGLNFQKLTHIQNAGKGEKAHANYYKSKLWMLGLAMIILGSLADFAALAFGAQSIIAPLGSLTLVSNVFFAPCLLGETLTARDIFATITIIFGATIAVIFASHKDTIYGLEQLFGFYEQPRFGLYAIFIMVTIGVLWSAIQYMETIRKESHRSPQYLRLVKYHRFCYAALSGTIGAQSVLFAKCTAELVVNSVMGQGFLLSYYQTWLVLICMCTTVFLQLKWLNQGLQRFDALYIVPVFQSFWILISVIAGLIFFGEYAEMNKIQSAMFPVGIFFTIAGVYFLSQRGVDEEAHESHSYSSSESHGAKRENPEDDFHPSHDNEIEHNSSDPLVKGDGKTSVAAAAHRERRHHKYHHQRIDSTVGFGGTGTPAGFLPTRAMVVGNSLRPDDDDEAIPEENEDDDTL